VNAKDPTGRYYDYDAILVADTIKDILAIKLVRQGICVALVGLASYLANDAFPNAVAGFGPLAGWGCGLL
jgi:hypothetical protein